MSSKNKKAIIISLGVLVLLTGLLVLLIFLPQPTENKAAYYENKENPTSVTVNNGVNNFTVSNTNSKWEVSSLENIPLNESFCYSLFNAAKALTAEHIFEPKVSLDEYGLESPKTVVTTDFGDKKTTLKIGNSNAGNTAYYCMEEGSNQIALVSISDVTPFLRESSKYASLTLIPYSMRTTDDDGNWVSGGITKCVVTRSDLSEPIELIADSNGALNISSPEGLTLSSDIQNQLENAPFSLTAEDVYKANPTDATIKSCGLDSPTATIKYIINAETYEFKIGSVSTSKQYSHTTDGNHDSGDTVTKSYYVMMEGTPAIYTVSQSNLPWLNMTFTG